MGAGIRLVMIASWEVERERGMASTFRKRNETKRNDLRYGVLPTNGARTSMLWLDRKTEGHCSTSISIDSIA